MSAVVYDDYTNARLGMFFGLTGFQLVVLTAAAVPVLWTLNAHQWLGLLAAVVLFGVLAALTIVPVKGRSALGWLGAVTVFAVGGVLRWNVFRSKASEGKASSPDEVDLPGVLAGVEIFDGPPSGSAMGPRPALICDNAARTWAFTAAVSHPGIGMADAQDRATMGRAVSELVDNAERTELIDRVVLMVRTGTDDGAEREQYLRRHLRADSPAVARQITTDLQAHLSAVAVRTESFVTFVVPDSRLARQSKESGGGFEGRARVLYGLMGEMEASLRGMRVSDVRWLSSPELAAACRTGFAPGDRAAVVDALAAKEHDPSVNADVAWAMAGPTVADPAPRFYTHDVWASVSATLILPDKGAMMGALKPVLTPTGPGERRSMALVIPIVKASRADRDSAKAEWLADMSGELRNRVGVKQRARARQEERRLRGLDSKLAQGSSLVVPYAVCSVTVPRSARVADYGRRLDASIRKAGFSPQRLDLSQDVALCVSAIPMGMDLSRRGIR